MGLPPPGIKVPELRLTRDGDWYVDGERIFHERTCTVLTENVHLLDDGRLASSIGRETVPIIVDDVGFFVLAADVRADTLNVRLSDGSEELVSALRTNDGRLYAQVKGGRAWARFSRAAHQSVEALVEERDAALGLRIGGVWLEVKS